MPVKASTHPVPCATTVTRLHTHRDRLATTLLKRIDADLDWYRTLTAEDRSWVGMVAQASIAAFIAWCEDPTSSAQSGAEIFSVAPSELTKTVSLRQALALLRTGVDVIEDEAGVISAPGKEAELHDAILRYSREFAFATAEVYARAAESRGSWDARLEALAIDALIRGQVGGSLRSRLAALGWTADGAVGTLVAGLNRPMSQRRVGELRHHLRKIAPYFLLGFQTDRVLVVVSGVDPVSEAVDVASSHVGPGPICTGPVALNLDEVPASLQAASRALDALPAWPAAPRPVAADELLPERALTGDKLAVKALVDRVYTPLKQAGQDMVDTVSAYLETGRSLEGSARELYVHANTVRYRLHKVTDLTGWDPSRPREAYVLSLALACGRLAEIGRI